MAKPGIKVTDKDKGWKKLKHEMLKLSQTGAYCRVGVQGAEAAANQQHTNLTVAQIATIHEFGKTITTKSGRTIVIPERSFIRAAIDEFQPAIQKRATMIGTGVVLLKFSMEQGLELLGQYAVGIMKQRIADGLQPPNRPSTIARKGSSKPLVDTGQLRNSITHIREVG